MHNFYDPMALQNLIFLHSKYHGASQPHRLLTVSYSCSLNNHQRPPSHYTTASRTSYLHYEQCIETRVFYRALICHFFSSFILPAAVNTICSVIERSNFKTKQERPRRLQYVLIAPFYHLMMT